MLQVLPWNAYNHNTPPPVSNIANYLPTPDTPTVPSSAFSRFNTKRKRTSDGDSVEQNWSEPSMGWPGNQIVPTQTADTMNTKSTSPPPTQLDLKQQPSDGLPTPMLSPTVADMDNKTFAAPKAPEGDTAESWLRKTRHIVTQQVNLEILVKHNELRLIDQEIAKCQVALEQLRRCTEIPYPATQLSQNVSMGTGPALRQKYAGTRLPSSPPPWGVTDGPYSRHYASWLLPDTKFDGGEPESLAATVAANGKRPAKGRHGRPSIVEDMHSAGMSSRSQRVSGLQSLSAGYAQPKEKASGPLLLKRKSDGAMVKLKCPDCGRHDFGSAQGFINHCRIGHSRTFSSHDAAAENCGEPVEYDAQGAMVGVEPVSQPITTTHVHPLVRSAHLLPTTIAATPKLDLKPFDGAADDASTDGFKGSISTPFLTALLRRQNSTLNLDGAVTDAKIKTELPEEDVEMSDAEEEVKSPDASQPHVASTRGLAAPAKGPTTSPVLNTRLPVSQSQTSDDDFGHPIEPSPTTDSNQAPSLIDDDEEYEAHSPASTPASDDEDVHVAVHDDDVHHDELPRSDYQPACTQPQQPNTSPARRPSAFRKDIEGREEKHVSFDNASPAPEQINADRSKRRKITK